MSVDIIDFKHGTTMQTGATCKKVPLYMSIEFGMALK